MHKILLTILFVSLTTGYAICQNIGIGVTNPAYKLDVGGRMRIRTGTLGNASTSSGFWLEDYRDGSNQAFFGMQDSIRMGFYGVNGLGWGFNFNTLNGNINLVYGSLGMGTITPVNDIDIYRNNPSIGFFDNDADNHSSGSILGDSSNLYVNAYRRSILSTNEPGNLIMQVNTGGFPGFIAGNLGIGTAFPDVKVHVDGGSDVTSGSGGYLQLGPSASANIGFDPNEIQARNNGVAAKLFLQNGGGGLQINTGSGTINFTTSGELNRNAITGTADLLPICYGKVKTDGSVAGGTGNFSVNKIGTGLYEIAISGETTMSANADQYVIIVSSAMATGIDLGSVFITSQIQTSGNTFRIHTKKFQVDYQNKSVADDCDLIQCDMIVASYISSIPSPRYEDNSFTFIVYKL